MSRRFLELVSPMARQESHHGAMNFVPPELEEILRQTPALQRAYLVGGCVRDALAGLPHEKDFDIEVFSVDYEQLIAGLARWRKTDLVGRSFGVVKLSTGSGCNYDFTLPRKDSKVAAGHKGFDVEFEPDLPLREAAARRDFTIYSIMYRRSARSSIFLAARRTCEAEFCDIRAPLSSKTRFVSCVGCNLPDASSCAPRRRQWSLRAA